MSISLLPASARRITGAWILPLTLSAACAPKPAPVTQAPQAPAPTTQSPKAKDQAPALARPQKPRPNISFFTADITVQGLDDLLQSSDKLAKHWGTPQEMPAKDLVTTFLSNLGFAANILDLVNLSQPFVAHLDLPHDSRALQEHFDLAMSVPAQDPRALVKGFPASMDLKAQGDVEWKASLSDLELSLRAGTNFLSIARSAKNLGRADKDRQAVTNPNAPRLSLHLDELSNNQRQAVLNSIPQGIASRLYPALKELSELTLSLDVGSERPLRGHAFAIAPWQNLRLPLSGPSNTPSLVAQKLPAGAAAFSQVMLGDTKPLTDELLKLAQEKIPAPFSEPSQEIVTALQKLSDEVASHVVAGYYMDQKNRGTILFAADLKDQAKGLEAVEALWMALAKGVNTHIELVKNSPEDKYSIVQKNKGPIYSGQRTQSLRVTVPKRVSQDIEPQKDLALIAPLITGKGKSQRLEGYSFVRDGYAVLALGAGSKDLVRAAIKLAKNTKAPLHAESAGGLANARAVTKGCQLCGYLDPLATLRALAVHAAAESGRSKDLKKTLKELKKIKIDGVIAGGAKLKPNEGEMAMQVPQSLVYPEPAEAAKLKTAIEGFEVLDDIIPDKAKSASAR